MSHRISILHLPRFGGPYSGTDILECLLEYTSEVSLVGSLNHNFMWQVGLPKEVDARLRSFGKKLKMKNKAGAVQMGYLADYASMTAVHIKMHWIPGFASQEQVQETLQQYGTVVGMDTIKWPGTNVDTSSRDIKMILKKDVAMEDLPGLTEVVIDSVRHEVMVTSRDLPPECRSCKSRGHIARDCKKKKPAPESNSQKVPVKKRKEKKKVPPKDPEPVPVPEQEEEGFIEVKSPRRKRKRKPSKEAPIAIPTQSSPQKRPPTPTMPEKDFIRKITAYSPRDSWAYHELFRLRGILRRDKMKEPDKQEYEPLYERLEWLEDQIEDRLEREDFT